MLEICRHTNFEHTCIHSDLILKILSTLLVLLFKNYWDPVSYTHLDVYKRQVCGLSMYTLLFRNPQRKKSHADKSGDLAGHEISPYVDMSPSGKSSLKAAMDTRAV